MILSCELIYFWESAWKPLKVSVCYSIWREWLKVELFFILVTKFVYFLVKVEYFLFIFQILLFLLLNDLIKLFILPFIISPNLFRLLPSVLSLLFIIQGLGTNVCIIRDVLTVILGLIKQFLAHATRWKLLVVVLILLGKLLIGMFLPCLAAFHHGWILPILLVEYVLLVWFSSPLFICCRLRLFYWCRLRILLYGICSIARLIVLVFFLFI